MVTTLEIIERSVFTALVKTAVQMGYSLNPQEYYPVTAESIGRFNTDKAGLNKYVSIYGAGTSTSRGAKLAPRIVVDSHGFYPGNVGLNKQIIEPNVGPGFHSSEYPYEALDQMIDIRLVTESQEDMRILHSIMFYSIPQKGYIIPWPTDKFKTSGNIFIELINFFNKSDNSEGIMEKVYQFMIHDCIIEPLEESLDVPVLTNITLEIDNGSSSETITIPKS